jgi:uncharacterized membrane protein YdjX (TVP38/TMEM64 family)
MQFVYHHKRPHVTIKNMNSTHRKLLDVSITILLSALIIWAFWSFFQGQVVFDLFSSDTEQFQQYISSQDGFWASFVYVCMIILEVLVAFIPGWFLYPAGAAVFGFGKTVALILIGNFIASSICFWIGQRWGAPLLKKFIAQKYIDQFNEYMDKRGAWAVFLLKLNPITSFDLWNYVAGASPLKFWKFALANTLGITPLVIFAALLGEEGYRYAPQLLGVLVLITVVYIVWSVVNLPHKIQKKPKN